jgi:N-acetylglucosaminyl-diphospho-decaprenol L-rhamnosyltransferase
MKELSIIIVNWNTADLTLQCLNSVYTSVDSSNVEVWVVDNASSDNSVLKIKQEYPMVKVIENTENVGFAKANNQVLKNVNTTYVMLLNSDTIVEKDAINNMVEYLKLNPEVGAVGPHLPSPNGNLKTLSCGFLPTIQTGMNHFWGLTRIPLLNKLFNKGVFLPDKNYTKPFEVEWLSGACITLRKEVIQTAGVLPEDYFMYAEDLQWCEKILEANWKIHFYPNSIVWHLIGGSAKHKKGISTKWLINLRAYHLKRTESKLKSNIFSIVIYFGFLLRTVLCSILSLLGNKWAEDKKTDFNAFMKASIKRIE